jgi:hypothetical protein
MDAATLSSTLTAFGGRAKRPKNPGLRKERMGSIPTPGTIYKDFERLMGEGTTGPPEAGQSWSEGRSTRVPRGPGERFSDGALA